MNDDDSLNRDDLKFLISSWKRRNENKKNRKTKNKTDDSHMNDLFIKEEL